MLPIVIPNVLIFCVCVCKLHSQTVKSQTVNTGKHGKTRHWIWHGAYCYRVMWNSAE